MNVAFGFKLGQTVVIELSGEAGTVIGLFLDEDGSKRIHVRYVTEAKSIEETWLPESALRAKS